MARKRKNVLPSLLLVLAAIAVVVMIGIGTSGFTDWTGKENSSSSGETYQSTSQPSESSSTVDDNSVALANDEDASFHEVAVVEDNTSIEFNSKGIDLSSTAVILMDQIYDYSSFSITLETDTDNIGEFYYSDLSADEPVVMELDFYSVSWASLSSDRRTLTVRGSLPSYDEESGWIYDSGFRFPLFVRILNSESLSYSGYGY